MNMFLVNVYSQMYTRMYEHLVIYVYAVFTADGSYVHAYIHIIYSLELGQPISDRKFKFVLHIALV